MDYIFVQINRTSGSDNRFLRESEAVDMYAEDGYEIISIVPLPSGSSQTSSVLVCMGKRVR